MTDKNKLIDLATLNEYDKLVANEIKTNRNRINSLESHDVDLDANIQSINGVVGSLQGQVSSMQGSINSLNLTVSSVEGITNIFTKVGGASSFILSGGEGSIATDINRAAVFGQGNTASASNQLITGTYCASSQNAQFIIGGGNSSSSKWNTFEIIKSMYNKKNKVSLKLNATGSTSASLGKIEIIVNEDDYTIFNIDGANYQMEKWTFELENGQIVEYRILCCAHGNQEE